MTKKFILLLALAAQYFAPDLQVSAIGKDHVNMEYPAGATEAEICEMACEAMEALPDTAKIVAGLECLDPKSSREFPSEIRSISLVKSSDCVVRTTQDIPTPKVIKITSDRFPGVTIVSQLAYQPTVPAPYKESDGLLERMIPRLFETRRKECFTLEFTSRDKNVFVTFRYESEQDNSLYFGLAFIKYFEEIIKSKPQGNGSSHQSDVHYIFDTLIHTGHPELNDLRNKIQSLALEDFPRESPKRLILTETDPGLDEPYFLRDILQKFITQECLFALTQID